VRGSDDGLLKLICVIQLPHKDYLDRGNLASFLRAHALALHGQVESENTASIGRLRTLKAKNICLLL